MALGAYGAHQFKPEDPYFAEVHINCTSSPYPISSLTFWAMKRDLGDTRHPSFLSSRLQCFAGV